MLISPELYYNFIVKPGESSEWIRTYCVSEFSGKKH